MLDVIAPIIGRIQYPESSIQHRASGEMETFSPFPALQGMEAEDER